MNLKKSLIVFAVIGLMARIASNAVAQEALVGSWTMKMTNTTFGITFEDLRTYHGDGTSTYVNQGVITESAGHGVWARQGNGYVDTFIIFEFDSSGNVLGKVRIRSLTTLIGQDSLTQKWQADFILPTGTVLPNVTQGTGKGSRIRLQTVTAVEQQTTAPPAAIELLKIIPIRLTLPRQFVTVCQKRRL